MILSKSKEGVPLDLDPVARDRIRALKAIDFELAYLALLTHQGLKPISRWERSLNETGLDALRHLGLQPRQIPRTVRMGKAFEETIFGLTRGYLDIYAGHFANRPVDKSAETVRIEGYLFGYPPCCIAQYVKHHYAPNEFPTDKQQTLFHWACKGCQITPLLVPAYEEIRRLVERC